MITKVPQDMVPTISKIALLFRKRTTLKAFDIVEVINKNRKRLRGRTRSLIQDRFILFTSGATIAYSIAKKSSIHFELLVVVRYDSEVHQHTLLTLVLQSVNMLSRFFCYRCLYLELQSDYLCSAV